MCAIYHALLSHSALLAVFTAIGALAVVDALEVVDSDKLAWWLAERQTPGGGLNGRPEKLPDVCIIVHIGI